MSTLRTLGLLFFVVAACGDDERHVRLRLTGDANGGLTLTYRHPVLGWVTKREPELPWQIWLTVNTGDTIEFNAECPYYPIGYSEEKLSCRLNSAEVSTPNKRILLVEEEDAISMKFEVDW